MKMKLASMAMKLNWFGGNKWTTGFVRAGLERPRSCIRLKWVQTGLLLIIQHLNRGELLSFNVCSGLLGRKSRTPLLQISALTFCCSPRGSCPWDTVMGLSHSELWLALTRRFFCSHTSHTALCMTHRPRKEWAQFLTINCIFDGAKVLNLTQIRTMISAVRHFYGKGTFCNI